MAKEDEEKLRAKGAEKKKPTHEEDGKLIKEDESEDEDCNKEAEDEDESESKKRKKAKKENEEDSEKEAEDEEEDAEKEAEEEEDEEEAKRKKTKKGELGGENPEEDAASATDANSSTSPGMGVPSKQNVFVPGSGVNVGRHASPGSMGGQSPSDVRYTGKSVDLRKSPLFVGISKEIHDFQKSMEGKIDAIEKSFNDRIGNLQKTIKKAEEFYNRPFYKAVDDNIGVEGIQRESVEEQIQKGKARFR